MLAPTVGPVVGGWITETWSWPWLFLINVIPGLIVTSVTPFLLPRQDTDFAELAKLDCALARAAGGGARGLEIGLKEAPHRGWLSPTCMVLLAGSAVGLGIFVHRSLGAGHPVVRLVDTEAAFVCGRLRA